MVSVTLRFAHQFTGLLRGRPGLRGSAILVMIGLRAPQHAHPDTSAPAARPCGPTVKETDPCGISRGYSASAWRSASASSTRCGWKRKSSRAATSATARRPRARGQGFVTHLVFFCGHAGTGKTTLAKRLIGPLMRATGEAFCLLDKDTLYGRYSSAAMGALTENPNDRDSPLYLKHLRDPEYQGLLDTARENLALGIGALVVGPLSREVRDRRILDRAWLGIAPDVTLTVVWVHVGRRRAPADRRARQPERRVQARALGRIPAAPLRADRPRMRRHRDVRQHRALRRRRRGAAVPHRAASARGHDRPAAAGLTGRSFRHPQNNAGSAVALPASYGPRARG